METINLTPFPVQPLIVLDNNGKETLLVVIKATYSISNGKVQLCEKQEPIRFADEYWGDPGASSIKYAGETALHKPATDVILLGNAYALGKKQRSVDVNLLAGKISKTIRVFGDRRWEGTPPFERISEPQPFDKLPLLYEKSFGGIDISSEEFPESESRNPVGVGFRARHSKRNLSGTPLPNIENPAQLIQSPKDRPGPAGTGFIAPHWEPRRSRAGTYDTRWQTERAPFLPDDYNPSFQQAAPADQIYPGYMEGGEQIIVENASPNGRLSFLLPTTRLGISVNLEEEPVSMQMRLDTVVIDGDSSRLQIVWRGNLLVHNKVYDIPWIKAEVLEEK
jgi:hypothetical protein